jgi:CheY-like chemotaxis protein
MPNTRKILIVDDDPQPRDALTEQLSPHEEFEAFAAAGHRGAQVLRVEHDFHDCLGGRHRNSAEDEVEVG